MARFPSDKPAKAIEEEARAETEVNQDDSNAETSINLLDSSTQLEDIVSDSFNSLGRNDGESVKDDNDFEKFVDDVFEMVQDEEGFNVISGWESSNESMSTTEEDFLMNGASQPIGVVRSVKGKQVIVEGKEKHNYKLVSKGSFLCLPETREPLGFVDEIFGSLEKPCYSVRLRSESQVLECISKGTQVSLIVVGCFQHDKKSYESDDTSSGDETVFSDDDEEEAEYGKMQKKMEKMGMSRRNKKNQETMYTQQDFRSDEEDYINQQGFGLSIDSEPWPDLNSNPFPPQDFPQTRSHRGGGRGFLGRGRDQHPRGGGRSYGGRRFR